MHSHQTRSTPHLPISSRAVPLVPPSILRTTSQTSSVAEPEERLDEDPETAALLAEVQDIQQKRDEVTIRYERRLEYLRAKLKGAELRERLLK